MDFNRKIVLVTGGSSGIGLALACALAAKGAHVHIVARRIKLLDAALAQFEGSRQYEDQHLGYSEMDVTDLDQVKAGLAAITEEVGFPDIVINSAGAAHPGYFQDLELDIFHWMMDVNYFGTVNVCKLVAPEMIARRSGHIVNLSSLAGIIGVFGYTAYGASKYAVRGLSDALRAELKPWDVEVSIVFPPDTQTPQLDYENQYKPHETKAISGSSSLMSAEDVAADIIKGIARKQYVILPGLEGKLMYRLIPLVGNLIYPIMDWMVARAQSAQQQSHTHA